MILQRRIELLGQLGEYMLSDDPEWAEVKEIASIKNPWFISPFVETAIKNITSRYLQRELLLEWTRSYNLPAENSRPKPVGIVMAGNIPLAGFHDLLCVFITGHIAVCKPSSKDETLFRHLVKKLTEWDAAIANLIQESERLSHCTVFIATGSNNSSRYFEYYFGRYPHIIRRNRSSAAILTGKEPGADLEKLSDDIFLYFGLGCRNVTKIYVPRGYDFVPLLEALKKYSYLSDFHKYKNNYDYNLTLHILNKKFYMTNGSILLVEDPSLFSPISQLNFEYYDDAGAVRNSLRESPDVQCVVGINDLPFGQAQQPSLSDYADREDTIRFLSSL